MLILIVLSLTIGGFTVADEIKISTYYPAPYGVYREMRLKRLAIGENYYNYADYCWEGGANCNNDIEDEASLAVEGRVGIGTPEPGRALHITSLDGIRLDPSVLPDPAEAGDIVIDSDSNNALRWYDGTAWNSMGTNIIWEVSLLPNPGWRCVDLPEQQCTGRGCFLKFKTIYSTGSIYSYSGTIDYSSATRWASFSSEADGGRLWRWNLADTVYGGSWAHSGLLWLGDCSLTSGGSCAAGTNDNLNLCVNTYNLEAFLLSYNGM